MGRACPEFAKGLKHYRRYRVAWVEYRMQCGQLGDLKARLKTLGLSGRLNTACVERVNLTIRQGVSLLVRRTWGTAQTAGALRLHLLWGQGYYHFVRPHQALRHEYAPPLPRQGRQPAKRYRERTPALAAGLTDHRWSVQEFITHPVY